MELKTKTRFWVVILTLVAFIGPFGVVMAVEQNKKLSALSEEITASSEADALEMLPLPVEEKKEAASIPPSTPTPIPAPAVTTPAPKTTTTTVTKPATTTTKTTTTTTKPKTTRKTKSS